MSKALEVMPNPHPQGGLRQVSACICRLGMVLIKTQADGIIPFLSWCDCETLLTGEFHYSYLALGPFCKTSGYLDSFLLDKAIFAGSLTYENRCCERT